MPPGLCLPIMALFRPCRSGHVDSHRGATRAIASRGQVLSRRCARHDGRRGARYTGFDGMFMTGLYILLAVILLHDTFAPHPFAPSMVLSCGNLSVQALDEEHPSAADFSEKDENTSVPSQRGILMPVLSIKLNDELSPFFHPLLTIAADERPPKS